MAYLPLHEDALNSSDCGADTVLVLHRYDHPGGHLFHLDLYRTGPEGAWTLGLEEAIAAQDWLVVEWAGQEGPWPTAWVAELTLSTQGDGRQAKWTLAGEIPG